MSEKRTIQINKETAREWWKSGGELKKLALSVFHESELKKGKKLKEYDKILEKFKKHYPIYSVVWSSEGTDKLPNIIVSEPYIGMRDSWDGKKGVIYFDTYRIWMYENDGELLRSKIKIDEEYDHSDFDNGIIRNWHHEKEFDYKDFKKNEISEIASDISKYEKDNAEMSKKIAEQKLKILNYTHVATNFDNIYNKLIKEAKNK